jgi:hypothetical protein
LLARAGRIMEPWFAALAEEPLGWGAPSETPTSQIPMPIDMPAPTPPSAFRFVSVQDFGSARQLIHSGATAAIVFKTAAFDRSATLRSNKYGLLMALGRSWLGRLMPILDAHFRPKLIASGRPEDLASTLDVSLGGDR